MRTVVIDRASSVPLTRQIYEFWRLGIVRGRFPGGERIPSTRDVARALGVSRGTVAQAYEQLVSEGYFQSVRGSGTFVCAQPEGLVNAPSVAEPVAGFGNTVRLSRFAEGLQSHEPTARSRAAGYICLSNSGPDVSLFPLELWQRAYVDGLKSVGAGALDYAEHVQGYEPLREEIAKYVARTRAVACSAENVIVVNGSQQGLDLCARLLLEPGDEVAIENPSYPGARRAFEACGARLRPVPVDREGIVCGELGNVARLVFVTPSRQYPTGVTLSSQRRAELIAWARAQRAVIVEDDYDCEYRYSGSPMPALQGSAGDVPVIYCGTFSKVMFPSLRIGYLIVPTSLVATFTRAKWVADRHTPVHQQAALYRFMSEGHLERHIRRMRRTYAQRRAALMDSLDRHFGARACVFGDAAGMHAYVRLDDSDVAARAERNKVHLRDARAYFVGSAPVNEYLMDFSMVTERGIREGIRRLAA